MNAFKKEIRRPKGESGATLVEVALLISMVALIALPAISSVGTRAGCVFTSVNDGMTSVDSRMGLPIDLTCGVTIDFEEVSGFPG